MSLDLYLRETATLAADYQALLDDAATRLSQGESLSALEQNGVLHLLQVVTENAIGKAKHLVKATGHPAPVSAYEAMQTLGRLRQWSSETVTEWNAVIGLRNRIVHEYMNLDLHIVMRLIERRRYQFILDFLRDECQ